MMQVKPATIDETLDKVLSPADYETIPKKSLPKDAKGLQGIDFATLKPKESASEIKKSWYRTNRFLSIKSAMRASPH